MPTKYYNTLNNLLARLTSDRPKCVVATNGCFDILHAGHVNYLKWARAQGDFLVLFLNSDASVKRIKGAKRPIMNEADRATVLGGLESVDAICFFDNDSPLEELRAIKPDVYVKADQYTEDTLPEAAGVKAIGTRLAFAPMQEGISTSDVIQRIVNAYGSPQSTTA